MQEICRLFRVLKIKVEDLKPMILTCDISHQISKLYLSGSTIGSLSSATVHKYWQHFHGYKTNLNCTLKLTITASIYKATSKGY